MFPRTPQDKTAQGPQASGTGRFLGPGTGRGQLGAEGAHPGHKESQRTRQPPPQSTASQDHPLWATTTLVHGHPRENPTRVQHTTLCRAGGPEYSDKLWGERGEAVRQPGSLAEARDPGAGGGLGALWRMFEWGAEASGLSSCLESLPSKPTNAASSKDPAAETPKTY